MTDSKPLKSYAKGNQGPDMASKRSCCYLIINGEGVVYLGATSMLKKRLRHHNARSNRGYTGGKGKWHLLAVRMFTATREAFSHEQFLKKQPYQKNKWKASCLARAGKISDRFNYKIDFTKWPSF